MLGSTADDIGVFPEMKEKGEHGGIYKGCINWSIALEKLGRKPAYVYYFTRALLGDDAGAFHSSELWYMFEPWAEAGARKPKATMPSAKK